MADESTLTLGPDEAAIHYAGGRVLARDGLTFEPDSIAVLPRAQAERLAGTDDLRIVDDLPYFLTMRARLRAALAP